VRGGVLERVFEVLLEDVDGARDEGGFRADGQGNGLKGRSTDRREVDFVFLLNSTWGNTALGEAVDAVVEQ